MFRRLREAYRRWKLWNEAYVYCPGTTASHWSGGDYPICSREDCDGETCQASIETEKRYAALLEPRINFRCETPCSDAAGTCSHLCPHLRK